MEYTKRTEEPTSCIIFKSYELLKVNPQEDFIIESKIYRDSWLEKSEFSFLIEEYYEISERLSKGIDLELAHEIIDSWLPSVIQMIRDEKFEDAAHSLQSFLISLKEKVVVTANVA